MLRLQREYRGLDFGPAAGADTAIRANTNGDFDLFDDSRDNELSTNTAFTDASDFIVDIREYDVPYHVRVMIDLGESYFSLSPAVAPQC